MLVVLLCALCVYYLLQRQDHLQADITAALQHDIAVKFDEQNKKLEVQGKLLSDSASARATVDYIAHRNWLQRLLSSEARKQEQQYQQILSSIPPVIQHELAITGAKPDNIAHIGVQIDSLDVLVEIGKDADFKRGYLKLQHDSSGHEYYRLHLYADQIDIVEVRTAETPDGLQYSYVTAKSKLTGQIYKTQQQLFPIVDERSGFRFAPWLELGVAKNLSDSRIKGGLMSWRFTEADNPHYDRYELNIGNLEVLTGGDYKIYLLDMRMNF